MAKSRFLNTRKVISHWVTTANHNYETARILLKTKRYPECLFFCHLMTEKILKALVVKKTRIHAPYTHKLVDLSKIAGIELSKEQTETLTTITEFNIGGRYEEYKLDFYKKATEPYTEKYFHISEKNYLWLKQKLSQKR